MGSVSNEGGNLELIYAFTPLKEIKRLFNALPCCCTRIAAYAAAIRMHLRL